jgi:hypothetical protein
VRTLAELRRRRDKLSRTWEKVLAEGSPVPSGFDSGLLASWRRSSAWVSPEVKAAPVDGSDRAIDEWRHSPVHAGLTKTEGDVRRMAEDGDLIAAVTDRTGRIVWTHGSPVMQRKAEQVNFVPGGRWDEASVGTNALALALRTGRPATVYSAEHFSRAVHGWVCYSVPLSDPRSGDVLGVLDLSTTWDRAHPLAMGTAQLLARMVTAAMPESWSAPGPELELRVLGGWQVLCGGRPLMLPRRQIEVLVLLAMSPSGLSLEALHDRLYGEARVSTATLKAEVSRLRTALDGGVGSRPYRLLTPVDSDLQRALRALDRGDVSAAASAARGPLLPLSESPAVREWREYLAVALRNAVLRCPDPDTVRLLADDEPYDMELQQHLVDVLPDGDPRAAAALARVHRAGSE